MSEPCRNDFTATLRCGVCHSCFHAHRHIATCIPPFTPFHEDFDDL